MQQPKRKVSLKDAERTKDSLNQEASMKKQAAYGAKNFSTSETLMSNARKDAESAKKWEENIKAAKDKLKK